MWVATSVANDIFVYSNKKLERFTGISKIQNPCVTEVIQDLSGAFWFGVSPSYAIRIKDGEETVYNISNPSNPCSEISSILSDSVGNYWIGTDAGVTIIHNGAFTYYDRQNGIPDDVITRMLEDNEGNIWIGFNRGGLQKLSRGKFFTVSMETSVNAICEDARRELTWIGTDSGVMCYKNGEFITNKVTELTKGNRVRHVGLSDDNELLISSYSSYPEIVVLPDDTIKIWTEKDGISNRCRVSIKTTSGDYYVGTTFGLAIIHKDGNISFFTKNEGLENHYIMWIYEDKKNQIWIGTNGHSQRVADYTKMLATELGENDSTIEKYYNIALLHDIGKIGVPDSILQKPGKLTDEEFSVMKSHAQRGYEILKDIKLQEDLAEGAHYHHERYDGKGYPDGLVGENIPWVARIIAVADTFDAMSSTRPYRKKMELSYIEEEIQRCSGTQFDPKVVDAFMRLYKKGAFDYLK